MPDTHCSVNVAELTSEGSHTWNYQCPPSPEHKASPGAATPNLEPPKPYWWLAQTKASLNQTCFPSGGEPRDHTVHSSVFLLRLTLPALAPSLWPLHWNSGPNPKTQFSALNSLTSPCIWHWQVPLWNSILGLIKTRPLPFKFLDCCRASSPARPLQLLEQAWR